MKVLFINNEGSGFAGEVTVKPGTTVKDFFKKQMPKSKPADCLIRINRQIVPANAKLKAGDRVTITPTKIDGSGL